jgi:hypothetical protein
VSKGDGEEGETRARARSRSREPKPRETEGSSWCRPVATDRDYRDIGIDYDEPCFPTHILIDCMIMWCLLWLW